eukprot:GHVT01095203.1.p1 GENE.GHVT01095203.1~~GHVT01095203.1.p1  ORF type:complete len:178 (+),score=14.02 GHVT01095203.1:1874-2407(+)
MKAHTNRIRSVRYSPCGRLLLTAADDKLAKLWDATSRTFVASLRRHHRWVMCARWGPQARVIATGADDASVILWDADTQQPLMQLSMTSGTVHDWQSHQTPAGNAVLALPLPQAATTVKRPAVATPRTGTVAPPTPRRATLTTPPTHRDTPRLFQNPPSARKHRRIPRRHLLPWRVP